MTDTPPDPRELAERVRAACVAAALAAFEDAAIHGLCPAGAWEAALGAMRRLDLGPLTAPERDSA